MAASSPTTTWRWSKTRTCRRRATGNCSARRSRSTTSRSPCRAAKSFVAKLADLQEKGVKFNMRVNHGVTHSVYINDPNGYGVELLYELPREMWEGDIDAGINYLRAAADRGRRRPGRRPRKRAELRQSRGVAAASARRGGSAERDKRRRICQFGRNPFAPAVLVSCNFAGGSRCSSSRCSFSSSR